jgi:hypothetical protein
VRHVPIIALLVTTFGFGNAQPDSACHVPAQRKLLVGGLTAAATAGSLVYLQQAWYKDYSTARFHFFNDNGEWLQMDKAGHAYTCYQSSRLMMDAFAWAGFSRKSQLWVGGTMGFAYMTAIEVMDGYSNGWGYSWGDQAADMAGTALAITQEALWKEQRVHLKFSYHYSGLAQYNPVLLGNSAGTRLLKDYNSQAYWIGFGAPLLNIRNENFPRWLLLSIGYSASGMIGARENPVPENDTPDKTMIFKRQRVLLLSLDVDFTKIKTRSRFLRGLFSAVNVLKVPFPTIAFSTGEVKGYVFR